MKSEFFGAATDVGRVRQHNEDNFVSCPELGLWVVADGMGGHEAGEVASAIAVEVIPKQTAEGVSLDTAIEKAHSEIVQAGLNGRGTPGMGCTVVALKLDDCAYQISWVGDSRGYLWNGAQLKPLTRDHSFVQQLIDADALTEEEARVHPQRSVITQALGIDDRGGVRVDSVTGYLAKGESILLCSDGLTGEVDDAQIAAILTKEDNPPQQVKKLISAANDNGGSDNITVIIVPAPETAPKIVPRGSTVSFDAAALNAAIAKKKTPRRLWLVSAAVGVIVLLSLLTLCSKTTPKVAVGGGGTVMAPMEQRLITETSSPVVLAVTQPISELSTAVSVVVNDESKQSESVPQQMLPRMGEQRPIVESAFRDELE